MGYPEDFEALETIEQSIWRQLRRAVKDRRSPGHTPTVASIGPDGAPRQRTVVLRGCDVQARTLMFHTDARSPKWQQLGADPRVAMHFYFPKPKLQYRVQGIAQLEHGTPATQAKWDSMNSSARDCYRVQTAPGTPIPAPRSRKQETAGALGGYPAFARIHVHVASIDWLYLAAVGHRRAQFVWAEDGSVTQRWVAP
ncbi:MAG: pyridoxamine 5'-phosphate oxidase family protein [Myxococcota bacterium]|nr:pyridoxamine 5'-phosphate oxidase family protein [Myxococcota bacterium]